MALNTVKVIRDYDGYFEREAKDIAAEIPQLGYEIIVEAGPYKSCDVSYKIDDENKKIYLEYYAAVRVGFGSVWHDDIVKELTEKINK